MNFTFIKTALLFVLQRVFIVLIKILKSKIFQNLLPLIIKISPQFISKTTIKSG